MGFLDNLRKKCRTKKMQDNETIFMLTRTRQRTWGHIRSAFSSVGHGDTENSAAKRGGTGNGIKENVWLTK
jgi:hypothetical protein